MIDAIQERNKVAFGHDFESAKHGFEYLYTKRRIPGQVDVIFFQNVEDTDASIVMETNTTTLKKNGIQRIFPAENKKDVIQWIRDLYQK